MSKTNASMTDLGNSFYSVQDSNRVIRVKIRTNEDGTTKALVEYAPNRNLVLRKLVLDASEQARFDSFDSNRRAREILRLMADEG